MSLSMAESAAAIKSRLGLEPLPGVQTFTRILHHDPASVVEMLQARFPALPLKALAAPNLARTQTRRGASKGPLQLPQELEIRREAAFTEAFDQLWNHLAPAYRALIRRDARYLTWKFRNQPHMQHACFGAYRAGRLAGYIILRRARPPEHNAGILVDLFAHPEDRSLISALVDLSVRHFYDQHVTCMVASSSVPEIAELLTTYKFKPRKTARPLACAPVPLPQSGWLPVRGDHDWDQYPLA